MLMGKKCCATDLLHRFTINFFFSISSPIIVVVKETYWTNIVESVKIFEHVNKLPSKSPLYEANEFQILEPLLVAMVSDLRNHFWNICLYSLNFMHVST